MFERARLYHTLPLDVLVCGSSKWPLNTPFYIEADVCMSNSGYRDFFINRRPNICSVLDCGVGLSPDLKEPTKHISKDPHWGVRYLNLLIQLQPSILVVPDHLGSGTQTNRNFLDYEAILRRATYLESQLMYVIQGESVEEAEQQIRFACKNPYITWVGFPRLVQYYGGLSSCEQLAASRMDFISKHEQHIIDSGKNVHMLGLNDTAELQFAGERGFAIDTRLASMAAIAGFNILGSRPGDLNIDLVKPLTSSYIDQILKNVNALNKIYYEH